jgi:hypothetical protein
LGAKVAAHLDVREALGQKLGVGAFYHGVRGCDHKDLAAGEVLLERQPDRLSPVTSIDIAPEVPLTQGRIVLEVSEAGIVLRSHHVGEPEDEHLQFRVPTALFPLRQRQTPTPQASAPTRSHPARRSQPTGALFAIAAGCDRSIGDELPSSHARPDT